MRAIKEAITIELCSSTNCRYNKYYQTEADPLNEVYAKKEMFSNVSPKEEE